VEEPPPQALRAGVAERLSAAAALGPGPRIARAEAESDGGCEAEAATVRKTGNSTGCATAVPDGRLARGLPGSFSWRS
jgi:hypothetical protein